TDARARDLAAARDPLGDERRCAVRTRLGDRPGPDRELARGVIAAREERLAAPGPSLHQLPAAIGLGTRDPERDGLGRLALGIARAGDELPEAAVLDDHRLAARRAHLVGRLVRRPLSAAAQILRVLALRVRRAREEAAESTELLHQGLAAVWTGLAGLESDLDVVHALAGGPEVARQLLIQRVDRVHPVGIALLDLVE